MEKKKDYQKDDLSIFLKNTKHSFKAISSYVSLLIIHTPHIAMDNDHLISNQNQEGKI